MGLLGSFWVLYCCGQPGENFRIYPLGGFVIRTVARIRDFDELQLAMECVGNVPTPGEGNHPVLLSPKQQNWHVYFLQQFFCSAAKIRLSAGLR